VLDVPLAAVQIAYGVILGGSGRLWVDDLTVEVVSEELATTDMQAPPVPTKTVVPADLPSKPVNAGFEE
jgi:serine/threonine-protein kinase